MMKPEMMKGLLFIVIASLVIVGTIALIVHQPDGPKQELGTLVTIKPIPAAWNMMQRSQIETTGGFYVVLGNPVGKKSGQVYLKNSRIWIEQENGQFQGWNIPNE